MKLSIVSLSAVGSLGVREPKRFPKRRQTTVSTKAITVAAAAASNGLPVLTNTLANVDAAARVDITLEATAEKLFSATTTSSANRRPKYEAIALQATVSKEPEITVGPSAV
ncbi:hypothetical protein [Maricaulis salignorans]|uniref:hypothetical protein n=1 Tax=Maricaulis salignorans TaxID=144026 RepID=UPI003A92E89F